MNTSTAITLNDRFSMIKKQPSNTSIGTRGRSRSRSRSRGRGRGQPPQQKQVDLKGSRRNQLLLNQLERQHKMRIAMKLKNKSLMTSRGRVQTQIIRNNMKRANVVRKALAAQNLRRTKSLTTFVPLNDAPNRLRRGRSRSRSRSRSRNRMQQNPISVQDRLGIRQPLKNRRMQRGGGRGGQSNGAVNQQRSRSRSRSRIRINRNNFRNGAAGFKRSNSVNARLGNNGPVAGMQNRRGRFRSQSRNNNRKQIQMNRTLTGRIIKRKNRNVGLNTQRIRKTGNAAARNVKKLQRGNNNGQARGRARTRGQNNNQGGQQRRGRSRTRRANKNRGGKPQISKEQLDKQLDEYMAKGSA